MIDWTKYPNFKESEFLCKHTGEIDMREEFLDRLQALRTEFGRPMIVTSGYRHPTHPIEARKQAPGNHSRGIAADIGITGPAAYDLVALAFKHGFTGIGISQKAGAPLFIHLDIAPRKAVWSY